MFCDTHTHLAPYSHDARQSVAELLSCADRQGLSAVCTADHYEKDIFYTGGREDIFDPAVYFNDLQPVQAGRSAGEARLLLGVELGYLPHLDDHFAQFVTAWPFDSVILSLHILEGEDPFINPELYRPGKVDVYSRYLRSMTHMIQACPNFDILGHFDYISRYAPYADRKIRYSELPEEFDNFLRMLIASKKALEINTRTIVKLLSTGYAAQEALPDDEIIVRYLELGGRLISLGSDGHQANEAGNLFGEAVKWLKSLGCSQLVHYEKRQAVFSPL